MSERESLLCRFVSTDASRREHSEKNEREKLDE